MAPTQFLVFCFALFAIYSKNALAAPDSNALISKLMPLVLECSSKFEIGADITQVIEKPENIKNVNPCLIACVLRKMKLMDDKGMNDLEKSKKMCKKYFKEEEEQKKVIDIITECSKVNEKEVSDGEKGCERAKLLITCYLPHINTIMPALG